MLLTVGRHSLCLSLALAASAAFADQPAATEEVITVTYTCESGQTVIARYDNTYPDAPTARLEYKGQTF